jgi:hypothetical protein
MKKIILLAMMVPSLAFSQLDDVQIDVPKVTLSANFLYSDPSQFGLSMEFKGKAKDSGRNKSGILNVSAGSMEYKNITGSGFVIELGNRVYDEGWDGFYGENFISYGNIKFNENGQEGTYSYWSIINPNIGYKVNLGANFSLDPSIGCNWKWEVKGKGIENKEIDNFVFRAGIKLGYSF